MTNDTEQALNSALEDITDVESATDIGEAWELSKAVLAEQADPEAVSKAHHLQALCAELEDQPVGAVIRHYQAAEEAAAEGHYYILAGRMAGAEVPLFIKTGEHEEATDAFLRQLEYWERLDLGHAHEWLTETRRLLNRSFRQVTKKKFSYSTKLDVVLDHESEDPARESVIGDLVNYHTGFWIRDFVDWKREDPDRVRAFAEAVLSWTDDPILTANAHGVLARHARETGAGTEAVIESLETAETTWRAHSPEIPAWTLANLAEQTGVYVNAGWRSEAIDTFIRALDYWMAYEPPEKLPSGAKRFMNASRAALEDAFKSVSNRKTRGETYTLHVVHCAETGRSSTPLIPEKWRREAGISD